MNWDKTKPYLFILVIFLLPLVVISLFKMRHELPANDNGIRTAAHDTAAEKTVYGLVIHGGAGNFTPKDIPAELIPEYEATMSEALHMGMKGIERGDSALQVVVLVIKYLEDSPLFNAGKGSVFTHEGTHELDASVMDGKTKMAGAVAGVSHIKNPIEAAQCVLAHTNHVLLVGEGAENFARNQQLQMVEPGYFSTEKQRKKLDDALKKEKKEKMGTVGCVVLDKNGNLAAGTSTGGMTNKMKGRVGDTPIIGAGTYADNQSCAISATGHGEFFIRYSVAYDIAAQMQYLNLSIDEASEKVIQKLKTFGGDGGVIGMDKNGKVIMKFNTLGMFRGYYLKGQEPAISFFND